MFLCSTCMVLPTSSILVVSVQCFDSIDWIYSDIACNDEDLITEYWENIIKIWWSAARQVSPTSRMMWHFGHKLFNYISGTNDSIYSEHSKIPEHKKSLAMVPRMRQWWTQILSTRMRKSSTMLEFYPVMMRNNRMKTNMKRRPATLYPCTRNPQCRNCQWCWIRWWGIVGWRRSWKEGMPCIHVPETHGSRTQGVPVDVAKRPEHSW